MYHFLKIIHIVAGSLLSGSLIALVLCPKNLRLPVVKPLIVYLSILMFIVMPVTGLAITVVKHYNAGSFWITASLCGFGFVGFLWLGMLYCHQTDQRTAQQILIWLILGIMGVMYHLMITKTL